MTEEGRRDLQWSPRVPKAKLRRLYRREAQGIYDEDLLDDVGWTLLMRCRDILTIYEAKHGRRVRCPRCARARRTTIIPRHGGRDEVLRCPTCGWHVTWNTYRKSFRRKQLNAGGAVTAFRDFVARFERARTPREKMLAIDFIIHAFHYSLRDQPDRPTRPVAVNLICGKLKTVVDFLDELSGGENSPRLQRSAATWRETYEATWWPEIYAEATPRDEAE
jgi:DNA-directed RNA polymerase subunit RPC12/RpoP